MGAVGIQLLNPSVILLLGFVLGYGTGVIRAGTNWNGIWVWCLPVLALVIAVSVLGGVDLHTIWVGYFYYAHPGVDEGQSHAKGKHYQARVPLLVLRESTN